MSYRCTPIPHITSIFVCKNTAWPNNDVPVEIVRRPLGDPSRGVSGGSPDILAKKLVIPAK